MPARSDQRDRGGRRAARRVLHPLRLRAAVLSRAGSRAACSTGAARATPRASSPRKWPPPSGCARAARRASAWSSWPARSGAATARWRPTASRRAAAYLINGEPTDNRLGAATRGVFRVRLADRRAGRALRLSRAGPVGHRGAHRRPGGAARRALARGRGAGPHALHGRTDRRRRGAERRAGRTPRRRCCSERVGPHDEVRAVLRGDGRRPCAMSRKCSKCRRCTSTRATASRPAVFAYTTDIPLLSNWGTPLLLGPGSIHVAHTDEEHVRVDELRRGGRSLRHAWRRPCWLPRTRAGRP